MKHLPINDFLTIQEAAKKLRVSTKTLRRWEAGGKLVPIRTAGGHRRYTLTQIEEVKKPKAKDIFKSFLTPPEISTSKIAEIAKEEARKEVINYKFWSLDSKDLTKVNEDEDQNKDLEILNNQGQTVHTSVICEASPIVSISNLSKGFYTIKIKNDDGIIIKKFIKQ